jgi:uncharacterized protein YciI
MTENPSQSQPRSRLQLWAILTRGIAPLEEIRKHRDAHLAHQVELEKAGIMFAAGPLAEPDGARVQFGLIVIRARDEMEARRIADSDPFHRAGVRSYTLHRWEIVEGRINVSVDLSDGATRLD